MAAMTLEALEERVAALETEVARLKVGSIGDRDASAEEWSRSDREWREAQSIAGSEDDEPQEPFGGEAIS